MDIQLKKKNSVEGSIAIQIKESDYASLVEEKLLSYTKQMRIKGFRPGHVPFSLVKKMHGTNVLVETVTKLLSDTLSQYLRENKLHVVGEPLPDMDIMQQLDWDNQQEFEFLYHVGWVGPYQVDLNKKIQVPAYTVTKIAEETIDEIMENLRDTHGDRQIVKQSVAGTIIGGTLTHQQLRQPVNIYLPVMETPENLPQSLIGLQMNDQLKIDIRALVDAGIQPLGMSNNTLQQLLILGPVFELKVTKIERVTPAAVNQAFFDKVLGKGAVESLGSFREKLRHYVLQDKEQEAKQFLAHAIRNKLLEVICMDLPTDFLKKWLQYKDPKMTDQDWATYYEDYVQELKWELIVQKVIESNKLSLDAQAVIDETKNRLRAAYQISDDALKPVIQSFLEEKQGDNYKRIYKEMLLGKVLDHIQKEITLVYQAISVEEFAKLPAV